MIVAREILVLLLACTVFAYAQGNSFTKVRYNGGAVASKGNAKGWGDKLTVTPEAIVLVLKDKQRVEIPSKSVTSLSYGQEAHRRVGTMIALAILVAPVALFGLFQLHRHSVQLARWKDWRHSSSGRLRPIIGPCWLHSKALRMFQ